MQAPLQSCDLWVFSWRKLEDGRGLGRPREAPHTLCPAGSEGTAPSAAPRTAPRPHGAPEEGGSGAREGMGGHAFADHPAQQS